MGEWKRGTMEGAKGQIWENMMVGVRVWKCGKDVHYSECLSSLKGGGWVFLAFSCNPENIHNLSVCTHIHRHAQKPPTHTQRSSDLTKNNCTMVHTWAQVEVDFVFGVYMLRCGGQRLKLGVSPSSMLPYLFEAVLLTEPRGNQCASLVGQNAQGVSLLPHQFRHEPLCPAFYTGTGDPHSSSYVFTVVALPTEPSVRTVSCVRPSLEWKVNQV